MIGQTVSHYRITRKLGAGGMGDVYLAEDTTLGRQVALKFLSADLQRDEIARKRFLREARSAAALDHPFICHVHEVGEADGRGFIVMEHVEGQTLRQRLSEGPMPLDEALRAAREIAEALDLAHRRGIVHRDLKPANIMLTPEGHAKIMDFGLAKRVAVGEAESERQTVTALTGDGTTLGTLAYMSPEQLRGKPLDARSDIFAFGVVLYEMIGGVHPFQRPQQPETIGAILTEDPPPVSTVRPGTPEALDGVLERMLAKDPRRRYPSVGQAAWDLERGRAGDARAPGPRRAVARWRVAGVVGAAAVLAVLGGWLLSDRAAAPEAGAIRSLAVLPLANLSGDPEQEYFADGITDALITDLGQIGALRVISRTSVMRFKQSDRPLNDIAAELGVEAVLEGSAHQIGSEASITVRLVRASSEERLWSQAYRRDIGSLLALQSELARTIAREIQIAVTPGEEARLTVERRQDPAAYEAYLKAMFHLNQGTPEGVQKGFAYIHQAIDADPTDARFYAGLATAYNRVAHLLSPPRDPETGEWPDYPRAVEAVRKALELDETLAEAHAARALLALLYEWDWAAAGASFRRALELNPNLAETHLNYGWYLFLLGQADDALSEMRRAEAIDPLVPFFTLTRGWVHWWAGQDEPAAAAARSALELNPSFPPSFALLGFVSAGQGKFDEAMGFHERAGALSPEWRWGLGYAYARAGRRDDARTMAASLEAESHRNPWAIAEVYVGLGDRDQALRWLAEAFKTRHAWVPWVEHHPPFAPLRDDPQFQALVRRLRLPAGR